MLQSTPSLVNFVPFRGTKKKKEGRVMVKRKLDNAVDESSVDQKIHNSGATKHNL